jgi:hypothetical protein
MLDPFHSLKPPSATNTNNGFIGITGDLGP